LAKQDGPVTTFLYWAAVIVIVPLTLYVGYHAFFGK
jgi:hypothetical protein